ncbi:MBOAT family O-acyltransferase [Neolewinella agarilytica]|uniref:MBOAT family O-acyltransferase n=1 Tax=Neolewinella agarilytica TaxID=478744 RepID=UPI0023541422|nr:MBOAT family O-acyltransferase [Neolewinella agarilytica]
MLFNSIDFALFFPLVFLLYWGIFNRSLRWSNGFLLISSYVFYGWWDWRFLFLIAFSSLIDYFVGQGVFRARTQVQRKFLLAVSLTVNLGLLGVFKYYNFFIENLTEAFRLFGHPLEMSSLQIILPVGISFYTFQTLSYTIDVYRNEIKPTQDIIEFFAFVSFFPQLVAGPIERARELLPQFGVKREFNYAVAVDGMRQILFGLFKKMVIADNCAVLANDIFNNYELYSGSTLLLGAIFFAFQIYGDFSGYSDIALGTASLLGFRLSRNFAYPYFSRDVAEFWRRWHISLTSWFRDYVYIPLGGSRGGKWMAARNTFIIFLVSGFWHGPNWTFLAWGGLNALFFLPLLLTGKNRQHRGVVDEGSLLPSPMNAAKIVFTFFLITFSWVFFRAENIQQALDIIKKIISSSLFELPHWGRMSIREMAVIGFIPVFLALEWHGRSWAHALENFGSQWPRPARWLGYAAMIFTIFFLTGEEQEFIYFQF